MSLQPFELTLAGGAAEARYRALRPEVDRMPWGTIDLKQYSRRAIESGRRVWTMAAFQEHRTGAACAQTLAALITAQAPLDLVALATRFPLDELAHVEMCARLASEIGGPVRLMHDPVVLVRQPAKELSTRLRCAELVVRNFCVGEAVSIPLLRASWKAANEPLLRAVLGRIVKDEAAHGRFGWLFLDWIGDDLDDDERRHLAAAARSEMNAIERNWQKLADGPQPDDGPTLGWMPTATYLPTARRAMQEVVERPLRERGLFAEK